MTFLNLMKTISMRMKTTPTVSGTKQTYSHQHTCRSPTHMQVTCTHTHRPSAHTQLTWLHWHVWWWHSWQMRIIGGMTTRMKRGTATHPVSAWRDLTMKTSAGTIVTGGTSPEKPSLVSWCYTANHPVSCTYVYT